MEIDVRRIAKLAKLDIPEEELPRMERELASIVSMVEKLPELASKESLLDPENTMELQPGRGAAVFPAGRNAQKRARHRGWLPDGAQGRRVKRGRKKDEKAV